MNYIPKIFFNEAFFNRTVLDESVWTEESDDGELHRHLPVSLLLWIHPQRILLQGTVNFIITLYYTAKTAS